MKDQNQTGDEELRPCSEEPGTEAETDPEAARKIEIAERLIERYREAFRRLADS